MARNKPRKSARRMALPVEEKKVYKTTEIKEATKLPDSYIVVPAELGLDQEKLARKVDFWDEKLKLRGMRIKRPIHVYKYIRVVKSIELCVETEENK